MIRVEALSAPFLIDRIHDGGAYALPEAPALTQTNLFLKIACLDRLYVKVPSQRGFDDYRKFVKLAEANRADVRSLEDAERFENLAAALGSVPDLGPLTGISSELAHYAVVHKLQHERLQTQDAVKIPRARFGARQSKGWGFFRSYEPAMFQEKVSGTTLWDMFDFEALAVRPEWQLFAPLISTRLASLLDSGLLHHIDWNIQNFVFDKEAGELFYVDLKPTTFVAKESNERNLAGIRRYYIRMNAPAPRHRRSGASGSPPRAVWFCLLLVACALGNAMVQHGGRAVSDWGVSLLLIGLSAAGYWTVVPRSRSTSPMPAPLAELALAIPLFVAVQLIPLPLFALKILSPERGRILQALAPLTPPPAFAALSMEPATTAAYLFRTIGYLLVFLLVRAITARTRRAWLVAVPLIAVACAEAVLGLLQNAAAAEVSGTYPNKNHFAGLLEMVLPLAIGCAITLLKSRSPNNGIGFNRRTGSWVVFAAAALMAVALPFSLSKMGFLGGIGGLFCMAALAAWSILKGRVRLVAIGLIGALFLMAMVTIPSERLASAFGDSLSDKTGEGRVPVLGDTLRLVGAYPVAGVGLGAFDAAFLKYQTGVVDLAFEFAHNDYLENAAELGVPGFLLAGAFVLTLFVRSLRAGIGDADRGTQYMAWGCTGAMTAIGLHSFTDFNLYIPSNALVLAWIMGMVAGFPSHHATAAPQSPWSRFVRLRGLNAALGCLLLLWAVPAMLFGGTQSESWLCSLGICGTGGPASGRAAASTHPLPELLGALSRDPASPFRWCDVGDALLRSGRAEEAKYSFSRALDLAPNIPPVKFRAADFYASMNDRTREMEQTSGILDKSLISDTQIFARYEREKIPAAEILSRGIPPNPRAARAWLRHQMLPGTAGEAEAVWDWMLSRHFADDAMARDYVNFFYRLQRYDLAAAAWSRYLGDRGRGYLQSNWLFNGDFESAPVAVAFDWNIGGLGEDVRALIDSGAAHSGSRSLRIDFGGRKNVDYHQTFQTAFVQGGRYRFAAFVRTHGLTSDQGVGFRIFDQEVPSRLDITTDRFAGTADWKQTERIFVVPPVVRLLAVQVVRQPSVRIDNQIGGTAWIDTVTLSRME